MVHGTYIMHVVRRTAIAVIVFCTFKACPYTETEITEKHLTISLLLQTNQILTKTFLFHSLTVLANH